MPTDIFYAMPDWLNFVVRLLFSAVCGFAIGFERKSRSKEAGIRTHTIVALGACLMMIISKYAFWDSSNGEYDGARIAAQIVSGIGFLGTGMIVYSKGSLHGLTTAAGIWATAGVGMAVGAGGTVMYIVAIIATALIILIHLFLHLPLSIFKSKSFHQVQLQFVVCDDCMEKIKSIFCVDKISRLKVQTINGEKIGTALIKSMAIPSENEWQNLLDKYPFLTSIEYFEEEWM